MDFRAVKCIHVLVSAFYVGPDFSTNSHYSKLDDEIALINISSLCMLDNCTVFNKLKIGTFVVVAEFENVHRGEDRVGVHASRQHESKEKYGNCQKNQHRGPGGISIMDNHICNMLVCKSFGI